MKKESKQEIISNFARYFCTMRKRKEKTLLRRLRSSYFTSIISITLVLFLLGLSGLLILNARKLSEYVKENIGFTVILKEGARELDVIHLQKDLDATEFVKSTRYIGKEEAAKELSADLGENFIDFLGYNPLLASIEVKLKADYANNDSIFKIEKSFLNFGPVKEVFYQKNLVNLVNENVTRISIILLIFTSFLTIISLALINNTIRLSVYSQRFLINSMRLVGANYSFIRAPFLRQGAIQGLIGGFFSICLLTGVILWAQKELLNIITFSNLQLVLILFGSVLSAGVLLTIISTFFSVNKFLKIKTEDLYI